MAAYVIRKAYTRTEKPEKTDTFIRNFLEQTGTSESRGLSDDTTFFLQYLLSKDRSMEQRLQHVERDVNLLKTTRPHAEQSSKKDDLFPKLITILEKLSSEFEQSALRLNNFIDLKNTLFQLEQEMGKLGDVYLRKSIVIFFDSIKHSNAEDLTTKQLQAIKEVGTLVCNEKLDKEKFREIYKKLLKSELQIIPEPKT